MAFSPGLSECHVAGELCLLLYFTLQIKGMIDRLALRLLTIRDLTFLTICRCTRISVKCLVIPWRCGCFLSTTFRRIPMDDVLRLCNWPRQFYLCGEEAHGWILSLLAFPHERLMNYRLLPLFRLCEELLNDKFLSCLLPIFFAQPFRRSIINIDHNHNHKSTKS